MSEIFSDAPQAIENSYVIAQRCNLEIDIGTYHLPQYPAKNGESVDHELRKKTQSGFHAWQTEISRKGRGKADEQWEQYETRLEQELQVIIEMGFSGYFLIVADFIQWAKDHAIPVGPGRGSGAGSLVAYALKITDLDPLEFDLLFERFLNPERVSMPDFDVDFCMDRRDEVIEHVAELYGRQAVSQIITFGTMAAKAVVRDVGRVLGHPYGFVDRISKLIPSDPGMTLGKAFDVEPRLPELYDEDEDVKDLIDMARILEGVTRNAGKHAGGVVIAPTTITDFAPLYCDDEGNNPVTQFDKNDVETAGLVKFDFLGLRTLTIIQWAIDMIEEGKGKKIDITSIPLVDSRSFRMLQNAETTAVFQLESRGMKELIKRLKPDCFEDIIALVALFRPGPLQSGMVDNFIDRKHGREEISYPDADYQHECLKEILEPTYGIILYQEQVMQIAQVMAGYTLMTTEAMDQLPEGVIPTHVFIQGGCGGLAGAVAADLWHHYGEKMPHLTVVEPVPAACLYESARAGEPQLVNIVDESLMAGLSCGEVSLLGWQILRPGARHFLTISDAPVAPLMKLLAAGVSGDSVIVAGESAIAGLAGLIGAMGNEQLAREIGLNNKSRVLVFGTEGATDPEVFEALVGTRAENIVAQR